MNSDKPKILMVDDKPENLIVLEKLLSSFDVDLYKATSGNEALALTLDHDFMLILLDVQMPGMDGYEVLDVMSWDERTKYIPVIFLTANYADEIHQLKGYQYGAVDYLFKPINQQILLGKVKVFFELYKQKMAYKQLQQRYQLILDSAGEGVFGLDTEGNIDFINPAAAHMLGREVTDLLGNAFSIMLPPVGAEDTVTYDWKKSEIFENCRLGKVVSKNDVEFVRSDQGKFPVEFTATPLQKEDDKEFIGIVVVFSDITMQKTIEDQLTHLALYDHLTQLPNRILFEKAINQALARAERHHRLTAVLFLDLDHFKNVNDTLGHDVGDLLLKEVSARLNQCVRETDTIARFGGDEFAIVLDEIDKPEDASIVAEKILEIMKAVFVLNNNEIAISTSIGIAVYPVSGENSVNLIKNADTAMYRAKQQGRSNYRFFTSGMNEQSMIRLNLAHNLRYALKREQLLFYYQPKFQLDTGKISGIEALLRWNHPEFGLMLPSDFLPVAEEIGFMLPLGEWVIRTACKEAKPWLEKATSNLRIAINLSGSQLAQANLQSIVQESLEEAGLKPTQLELELTETVLMSNPAQSLQILDSLHELGVHISIDDFGTGYSSLSYLKKFPVDALKIDQSFIHEITTDANDKAIVKAIIAMAHSMDLIVVGEGVEHKDQLTFLKENGCNEVQGFLYGYPMPGAEMKEFLLKHGAIK